MTDHSFMTDTIAGGETGIRYEKASDYDTLIRYLDALSFRYSTVRIASLGTSVFGRRIPVITIGASMEQPGVLYVGGMAGDDRLTPAMLLRFASDYAEYLESGKRMYSISLPYLYGSRTFHIIPLLNPDGASLRRNGADDCVIGDRLAAMTENGDFSHWDRNGRGVPLWENFLGETVDGRPAESEPETSALCAYLRMAEAGVIGEIRLGMEFHLRSSEIRYRSGDYLPSRAKTVARLLSRMTGCAMSGEGGEGRGFTDWFIRHMGHPCFDCGCLAEGEVIPEDAEEYIRVYAAFREALFSAPMLI